MRRGGRVSLAKFSSDFLIESFTLVDNLFINEHLPHCSEKQLKVYLYGLYMCSMPEKLNSMEEMCATLDVTEAELVAIYPNRYVREKAAICLLKARHAAPEKV